MAIMSSILIPSFTSKVKYSDVKLNAELVRGSLVNAQVMALANSSERIKQMCLPGSATANADYVYVDYLPPSDTTQYFSVQIKVGGPDLPPSNSCSIENPKQLSSNLKLDGPARVFFKTGTGEIQFLPADSLTEATVVISAKTGNLTPVNVTVNKATGQIRVE